MQWTDKDRNTGEWAGGEKRQPNRYELVPVTTNKTNIQRHKPNKDRNNNTIGTKAGQRWTDGMEEHIFTTLMATAGASHCICNGHIDRRPQRVSVNIQQIKSKFKHITEQNSPSGPRLRCGTHSRARLPRGTGPCGAPGHNPPGGGGGGGEAAVGPSLDCWGVSEDLN